MDTRGFTIPLLLVDDRPENLVSLAALLEGEGFQILTANSGNEALLLTLKHDIALVLLDVQMPEMDGFETATLMRANPKTRHIPIIFVTAGMKELQFQFKGYDAGAVDYLTKPIEPVVIRGKVKVFGELYLQRQEIEQHRWHLDSLVAEKTVELNRMTEELLERNRQLQESNRELQTIEEDMRHQIQQYMVTHDQLLATEEVLRVQLEEYEIAQVKLQESVHNLQTLFDVSPLPIVVSNYATGRIVDINATFRDDFGYPRETVIGHTGLSVGFWCDSYQRELFLQTIHQHGRVSGFSATIKTCGGVIRSVLLYSTEIEYNNQHCLLIVFMDVSEQKMLEEQIRQSQKMDVLGQLAGGVAHDFNNMLTAILGSAELLSVHVGDKPLAMKLLGNIQQAAGRSADLTQQLLSFSRKGQKDFIQLCMHDIINQTLTILQHTIDRKITVQTKLVARATRVVGNSALLQNAILNLGVNARDAMSDGGQITISTANVTLDEAHCHASPFDIKPGNYIEISVADTGTGIDAETLNHIFEPFFTTKDVGKGTGLGLAAVYGTLKDHAGSVTVASEPNVGTVFKLYLPVTNKITAPDPAPQSTITTGGGVLLVDDEELVREIGKELLQTLGYQVYLAENGLQALEVYEQEQGRISLVILDMVMPKMGGKETLEKLKERNCDVKVLIASGFNREGSWDELQALGARGFMAKPFTKAELVAAIEEVMCAD